MSTGTKDIPRGIWAKLPLLDRVKMIFMAAGFVSFLFSVYLWFFVDRELGLFVGLWVPSVHSLGTLLLAGERGLR
jgi:hypothetical protein